MVLTACFEINQQFSLDIVHVVVFVCLFYIFLTLPFPLFYQIRHSFPYSHSSIANFETSERISVALVCEFMNCVIRIEIPKSLFTSGVGKRANKFSPISVHEFITFHISQSAVRLASQLHFLCVT
jgi:hypothetical protein